MSGMTSPSNLSLRVESGYTRLLIRPDQIVDPFYESSGLIFWLPGKKSSLCGCGTQLQQPWILTFKLYIFYVVQLYILSLNDEVKVSFLGGMDLLPFWGKNQWNRIKFVWPNLHVYIEITWVPITPLASHKFWSIPNEAIFLQMCTAHMKMTGLPSFFPLSS